MQRMSAVTSAQVQKCRLCAAQLATLPHSTNPHSSLLSLYLAHCRSAVCKLYYENFILIERVGVVATLVVGTVVAVVIVVITVVVVVLVIFVAVLVIIVVDFSVVLSSAAFHIHCAHFDCVALWQMVFNFHTTVFPSSCSHFCSVLSPSHVDLFALCVIFAFIFACS